MNDAQLIEVFGGVSRFRVLQALFSEPGRGFGPRELAAASGIDPGNAARLLKRWTEAGLVQRRQQDGLPRYYASTDPQLAPLVTLMQQDSELVRTLREALAKVKGVDVALVFGSVARGEATAGSDVDVLVLGDVSELKVNAALKPAGRLLGRAVRATASTIEVFKNQIRGQESFALEVVQKPRIPLLGNFDASILSASGP
jgi:DNA-binding MarR family transcriptional regulator